MTTNHIGGIAPPPVPAPPQQAAPPLPTTSSVPAQPAPAIQTATAQPVAAPATAPTSQPTAPAASSAPAASVAHVAAPGTTANERFYERAEGQLVTLELTFKAARQSSKSAEAEATLAKDKNARIKANAPLIPDDMGKAWRGLKKAMEIRLRAHGWQVSVRSGKAKWMIPALNLTDVLEVLADFDEQKQELLAPFTTDWDKFRAECLSSFGTLAVPANVFPYTSALDYLDAFKLLTHIEAFTFNSAETLPSDVVNLLMKSSHTQLDLMLDNIRNDLRTECISLSTKIGGEMKVSKATFNELLRLCESAHRIVGDACPIINNLAVGFPGFIARYEKQFKLFGPVGGDDYNVAEADKLKGTLISTATKLENIMIHDPADL